MNLLWEERAWKDYCSWQATDKKTLKKINAIIIASVKGTTIIN